MKPIRNPTGEPRRTKPNAQSFGEKRLMRIEPRSLKNLTRNSYLGHGPRTIHKPYENLKEPTKLKPLQLGARNSWRCLFNRNKLQRSEEQQKRRFKITNKKQW